MAAFAFIFGVVPLETATGAGSEMRHALATAVFSGMLGVTLLSLCLTPVFCAASAAGSRASPVGRSGNRRSSLDIDDIRSRCTDCPSRS